MIDYGVFQVSAAPNTGILDFASACLNSGLKVVRGDWVFNPYLSFKDWSTASLKVSLVRHPCDYLISSILAPTEKAVRHYLDFYGGLIGSRFFLYAADTYIRCEEMKQGFTDLLLATGVPHRRIRPPDNVKRITWPLSQDLYAQVMRAEREMAEMFDYW